MPSFFKRGLSALSLRTSAKKKPASKRGGLTNDSRQRPTLPHTCACSTIGGGRLNYRVRNGNGCDPAPMTTGKLDDARLSRRQLRCPGSGKVERSSQPRLVTLSIVPNYL